MSRKKCDDCDGLGTSRKTGAVCQRCLGVGEVTARRAGAHANIADAAQYAEGSLEDAKGVVAHATRGAKASRMVCVAVILAELLVELDAEGWPLPIDVDPTLTMYREARLAYERARAAHSDGSEGSNGKAPVDTGPVAYGPGDVRPGASKRRRG